MDEQEFKSRADEALQEICEAVNEAAEDYEGFEADFSSGALAVEFDAPPAKFVVSPNTPVRQVWVSAHTRSFKLDWNAEREEFVFAETNQTLLELIEWAIGKQIGREVVL
ncbi:MAG TPA: iron donor protein CyaY [Solibacterales bacterium]|nr:iron donor protein CyaY [Bryobacterales bacterium]